MSVPILTLYLVGIVLVILGLEADNENIILYFGLGFVVNTMAYLLSYGDTDYLSTAYLPLILMAICVLKLIHTAWALLPIDTDWGAEKESE